MLQSFVRHPSIGGLGQDVRLPRHVCHGAHTLRCTWVCAPLPTGCEPPLSRGLIETETLCLKFRVDTSRAYDRHPWRSMAPTDGIASVSPASRASRISRFLSSNRDLKILFVCGHVFHQPCAAFLRGRSHNLGCFDRIPHWLTHTCLEPGNLGAQPLNL